jgi:YSIRK-targeted surface antigen transcriptional regulator
MDMTHSQTLCTLASTALRVPSCFVTAEWETVREDESVCNPLYGSLQASMTELAKNNVNNGVTIHTTELLENYLSIPIPGNGGYLIIGPTIHPTYTEEMIKYHLADRHITVNKKTVLTHYEALPRLAKHELAACARLLYMTIYGKPITNDALFYAMPTELPDHENELPAAAIKHPAYQTRSHHNLLAEKRIIDAVRSGQANELKLAIQEFPEELYGVLSKRSYLRSHKNIVIAAITLAARAAIEGGVDTEDALTLSDLYIQQLEDLLTIEEVKVMQIEALSKFAERVEQVRNEKYSKAILTCLQYISNHLYENITLDSLAESSHISPNYLSTLFKKEVGMSPTMYIQHAKVQEAKKLLMVSDYSLIDICLYLSFHDQSHFTKVFKKHTGQTPRQYRQRPLENNAT